MNQLETTLVADATRHLGTICRLLEHRPFLKDDTQREFAEAWGAFSCLVELALAKDTGLGAEAAIALRELEAKCARAVSAVGVAE